MSDDGTTSTHPCRPLFPGIERVKAMNIKDAMKEKDAILKDLEDLEKKIDEKEKRLVVLEEALSELTVDFNTEEMADIVIKALKERWPNMEIKSQVVDGYYRVVVVVEKRTS